MRESTRVELVALCQAHLSAKDPADQESTLQALFERAPRGVYYVRSAKGVPMFRLDVPYEKETGEKTGEIGVAKADAEDKQNRPVKH